jgi:hypothetical protein
MDVPAGARVPPGRYEFVVGRYEGGRLVQVLFRTWIEVTPPG